MHHKILNYAAEGIQAYKAGNIESYRENIARFIKSLKGLNFADLHYITKALTPCDKHPNCKKCTKYFAKRAQRSLKLSLDKEINQSRCNLTKMLDLRDTFEACSFAHKYMNKRITMVVPVVIGNSTNEEWILKVKKEPRLNKYSQS